jgi:stage II sporulation protein P
MSIDEIILQIIFFAAGIFILVRIFIPIINPASIATSSNYIGVENGFYSQILNKANSTIDIATIDNNEKPTGIASVLFTYLTGIDLSNPKTYIASQLPMLRFIDSANLNAEDESPIIVTQREPDRSKAPSDTAATVPKASTSATASPSTSTKTPPISSGNKAKPSTKKPSEQVVINTVNPNNVKITKKKLTASKPTVLIFHTHTTESYNPGNAVNKNFSSDLNTTVNKIGTSLDYQLETQYGISVIHDSTIHDLPKRLGAYEKSRPTIQKYLKKYPSIKLVIDLHRDGEVKRNIDTAIINNEKYARVMFVAGIKFKNHEKNNATTQKLESEFDYLYPGLSRGIDYKNGNYNQDLSPKVVLMEVGSNENSIDEALRSTKVIAKVIANYLK